LGGQQFEANPGQKKIPEAMEKDCAGCACHPSYRRESNRRITIQDNLGKKQDLISKITRVKRAGEWLEHLPSKLEALSLNPRYYHPPKYQNE
jgi:hypothetical protein